MSGLDEPGEEPFVPENRNDDVWKRWRMTDLASRIADGRKKAYEAVCTTGCPGHSYFLIGFQQTASPSLFIEMAAEIDRLTAELEKARQALQLTQAVAKDQEELVLELSAELPQTTVDAIFLRTAARVHAETK